MTKVRDLHEKWMADPDYKAAYEDYPCLVTLTPAASDGSSQLIRRYRDGREVRQFCADITAALYALHDAACIELNWPEGQC